MAKSKRIKIVKVPGTTNNITKGIINYLTRRGHLAFRVNNGGVWDPVRETFRTNAKAGVADIIACLSMQTACGPDIVLYGQFMAIEVKNQATSDKMSEAQNVFKTEVLGAYGAHVVATGYDEFVSWFESIYGKI